MRKGILGMVAALAVVLTSFMSSAPAVASDWYHRAPAGYGTVQTVRQWGYYPRYNHVYSVQYVTDPYAYRYESRGYYPYYNSGYWRPAAEMRARRAAKYRLVHPPYYAAWGYPDRTYSHRRWHAVHHGYIRRHHW